MRTLYVFLILLSCFSAFGQVEKQVNPPKGDLPRQIPPDSSRLAVDTVVNKRDTLTSRADSLRARRRKSDIETTIVYSARDSLNSSMDKKIVHLYGDAKIKYGTVELMAEEITIDYENSTITANGKLDSLGKRVGYPVFVNGSEKYETKDIVYNFKSKKAKISEIVTKQGDAVLHGSAVYKNEKNELFSIRNGYTTCNLRHPHYQIMASRAKSIPGDKTVVGPFHMIFNDVPLPLGFAFGMFPAPRKSKSGVIVPAYGEERRRGFFLRNGGWFFDINDYVKVALTGDVYTRGSSAVYLNSTYTKRYKYSGSFNFSFTNNRATDNIEDRNTTKDFRLAWNHSPQSRGTGRFSASVNAATATFNNNNFLGINTNPNANRIDNTSRKLSSNVSYSKTFGKNLSLGINLRHNQDITTKQVDLPLPDVSFNVNNLYPFKKISKSMVLENLSVRYTMTGTNQITNNLGRIKPKDPNTDSIATFNLQNLPIFLRNSRRGIRHQIPIATSFKALKFFTFSPSLSYDERWYFERYVWSNPVGGVYAKPDTLRGFNRISNYSASLGVNTRIYGTYFFKRKNGIQAIRHIVNPSASISYQPDFSKEQYGYYQKLTDQKTGQTVFKSVHDGFVYGSSGIGESAAIGFGINNNLEMKVKSKKDTVAKKVSILNTLSISSGYNLLADSFKLANFSLAANTNVLNDKLNINITANLDPYKYVTIVGNEDPEAKEREIRTRLYSWNNYVAPAGYTVVKVGGVPGRITNANLALSTNLNPKGQGKDNVTRDKISKANISDTDKQFLLNNPDTYVDFNIPWNLRLSYNVDYSRPPGSTKANITQAMRFNGDISLTEKWKIQFNSGYDFQQKEITQTLLTLARDLHCWQLNLSWTPFGKFQSYNFFIGIKSSMLKDLKLNRTRSFFDN